jgi:hypothetical protein
MVLPEVSAMKHATATILVVLLLCSPAAGCRLVMDIPEGSETTCGNAVLDPGEACDGAELGDATCETLGFWGGSLSCADDCTPDTTLCVETDPCGDGQIGDGENCDGEDLDGQTCQSLGYHGGTLACADDCTWNLASCELAGRCGDGILQAANGETCDGAELDGQTCQSLDYHGGTLACTTDCTLELASCVAAGRCGDGVIQAASQETCDGADLGGQTCTGMGYYGGALACAADCTLNLASCVAAGRCGDGVIQTANGENCDGVNLGGQTCSSLGYYGGTLSCVGDCTWHLAPCALVGRCGDGIIQGAHGETCDGSNLDGQTCIDLGYCGGTLSCRSTCLFQTNGCSNDMCK